MVKMKIFKAEGLEEAFNKWSEEAGIRAQIQSLQFIEGGDMVVFYVYVPVPGDKPKLVVPKLEIAH